MKGTIRSMRSMKKTKSVLFVAPSAYTLGGLATWLDYIIPGLNKLGWRATLGLVEGPKAHNVERYLQIHPQSDWISIPCNTGTARGRRNAVRRVVECLQPDVLLSVNIPDAIIAVSELRAEGKTLTKVAMTCHGIQPDLFQDMALLTNSMDAVVCTNRLACQLAETLANCDKNRVLYAACGTKVLPLESHAIDNVAKITYVGRLEGEQKRVHDLVDIVHCLERANQPYFLKIVGSGGEDERLRKDLSTQISKGTVSFLGHVLSRDLEERVYKKSDIVLVPSLWETGPIVVWEAMAIGIPVICARYIGSGLENTLKHRQNCLMFEVGDAQTAAAQISMLHHDKKMWSSLRQRGWEVVSQRYSIKASVAQWNEALSTILTTATRPLKVPELGSSETSSKLNRLFGEFLAELIRETFKRTGPDSSPSGEWPHRLSSLIESESENAFWLEAKQADRTPLTLTCL